MGKPAAVRFQNAVRFQTQAIAAVGLAYLCIPAAGLYWRAYRNCVGAVHPFNDFYALWSVARLSLTGQIARLYDFDFLTAFRAGLGIGFDPKMAYAHLPYSYPPLSLLFLVPLGLFSYKAAWLLWSACTFALYALALLGRPTARHWMLAALILLLLPANVYWVLARPERLPLRRPACRRPAPRRPAPLLSGLCLGLLAFKPQLAILVPVALAAAGHWRAFAATALATLLLAALSGAIFGWPLWHDWLLSAPQLTADLRAHGQKAWPIVPTVMANLLMAGVSWPWAGAMQSAATILVAATIWIVFRRTAGDLAVAALLAGTFLATPYAFIYDMPIIAAALVLAVRARARSAAGFSHAEIAIIAAATVLPYLMEAHLTSLPLSAVVLGLLFIMIVRDAMRAHATPAAIVRHCPEVAAGPREMFSGVRP